MKMALIVVALLLAISARAVPISTSKDPKVLNNLVVELINVRGMAGDYRFSNPRDGWVFVSFAGVAQKGSRAFVAIDSTSRDDAIIMCEPGGAKTAETMRYLPAGAHRLVVRWEGKPSRSHIIVRSVPEILYAELGYESGNPRNPTTKSISSFGPYNWEYLGRVGILKNVNVLIERGKPEDAAFVRSWRESGRKAIRYANVYWPLRDGGQPTADGIYGFWSGPGQANDPGADGVILDEFSYDRAPDYLTAFAQAIQKMRNSKEFSGKVFYIYCQALFKTEQGRSFLKTILDGGCKLAEETYLTEQSTELAARNLLNSELKSPVVGYREVLPECQERMILCLSYMTAPPETVDINPGVDWKVWMDMQLNYIANEPTFSRLYGIMSYHSAYANEEAQRWVAKLYRHYCIEGSRKMLSSDPYLLPHIQNPDFDDGTNGWTLLPAENGSISVKHWPKYFWLQGRYGQTGDNFLWTKRSGERPNSFSQQMRKLKPGRLYSLTMFTADYGDMVSGKSVKRQHQVSIKIPGAQLVPAKSFQEVYGSGEAGHSAGAFNGQNNLWITYHRLVFRAKSANARLVISDWANDREPGGPIGQEQIYNFVQVQPYLED